MKRRAVSDGRIIARIDRDVGHPKTELREQQRIGLISKKFQRSLGREANSQQDHHRCLPDSSLHTRRNYPTLAPAIPEANYSCRSGSKDLPQPQLCAAWGLVILKPPPVRASEKSTTEPRI